MKVKIFLAGLSLALVSCESMDLVPKSQGIQLPGTQVRLSCLWRLMSFTYWVIGKNH